MKQVIKLIVTSILTWEAKLVLRKYKPKIVGVTGSVGKTSTKDAIAAVLSAFYFVRKTDKSLNSELGVPLTILGCENGWNNPFQWLKNIGEGFALIVLPNHYPEWLVLEIGTDRPGDIGEICSWVKPDIAVMTKLSKVPVHVEFFKSVEEVFAEKSKLVLALKRDGKVVLNADDEDVMSARSLVANDAVLYGEQENADIRGMNFHTLYLEKDGRKVPTGIAFDIADGSTLHSVEIIGSLGRQQMLPALAASAVAKALNLDLHKALSALHNHVPPPGRMRILDGNKKTILIDDTYNSSPVALEEALNTLQNLETSGRKIAVLGDMLEIGTYSTEEHKKAGMKAGTIADVLYTVGIRARMIAEGAQDAGMNEANIFQYEDSRSAGKDLDIMMREGDTVLIKGSQGIRMERITEEVMAEPEKAKELLVRQNDEWKAKK